MATKARTRDSSEVARPGVTEEQDRSPDPTRDEKIRYRAYELYLERGADPGNDLEDWFQAERELSRDQAKVAGE